MDAPVGAQDSSAAANTPAIAAEGLSKAYAGRAALSEAELTLPRGAFCALLGANGAGKSTLIGLLTGMLAPDDGHVRVLGRDPGREPVTTRRAIGVVAEDSGLFDSLTGRQHLEFCARLHGLAPATGRVRSHELLGLTGLDGAADRLVSGYSKGMRRRLAIAAALVHAPALLILDEPFEGIDVVALGVIRALLARLTGYGVTVLLSTHVLELADRLASHAVILADGEVRAHGSIAELLHRHGAADVHGVFRATTGLAPAPADVELSFYQGANRDGSG